MEFKKEQTRTFSEKQRTGALFDLTIAAENLDLQTPKFIVFLKSIKLVEMTLKYLSRLMLLLCVLSCSKSEQTRQLGTQKDSISYYINKASDIRVSYNQRLAYNQKAQELLLKQKYDSLNSDRLIKVAKNFYRLNSWKLLKTTSQKALARSINRKDSYFVGQSYRWLGVYYECISINDSAFYYYLKAEKIFRKLNDKEQLCEIFQDKALIQFYVCDFLSSESSLIRALKISNNINDSRMRSRIYVSLGLNSAAQKDYSR